MHPYEVIKRPVLTEKSSYQSDVLRRYTFEVDVRANKHEVRRAVETAFNVKVQDVNMMTVRGKQRRFGRHIGKMPDWKKAVVTLAPGESISFFEGV
ncbi:MAG TPA: 50S ribosomal protein L23 [Chloroflexi bacterium]|nr:50S ribosomal protein L23 [Chloroflexota bacterium]